MHVLAGLYEHFSELLTPWVHLVLRESKRPRHRPHPPRIRLPITLPIMQDIKSLISQQPHSYKNIMLWPIFSTQRNARWTFIHNRAWRGSHKADIQCFPIGFIPCRTSIKPQSLQFSQFLHWSSYISSPSKHTRFTHQDAWSLAERLLPALH